MTKLEALRRIAGRDPRYLKKLPPGVEPIAPADGQTVAPRSTARTPLPCIHLGDPTGEIRPCKECTRTTNVPLRACAKHGVCSETKLVTLASGKPVQCCSICPDRPKPERPKVNLGQPALKDAWQNPVSLGDVPKISLSPTRPRAIVTIASNESKRVLEVSGSLMEAYARRLDADLVVLDWEGPAIWPMGCKFQIPQVLDYYDRIAYVDADVILRPGCLDLFEATKPGTFGGYSELGDALGRDCGLFAEYRRLRQFMGRAVGPLHPIPFYINTGVMVLERHHRYLLSVPVRPIATVWCAEQHYWNSDILDSRAAVTLLPREANWAWHADPGWKLLPPPPDAILHFSGMHSFDLRIREMRKWADSPQPQPVG